MLILMLASAMAPLDACAAAVRGDLAQAAQACALPPHVLKPGADPTDPSSYGPTVALSEPCSIALKAGQAAGKYGPSLPAVARAGYVRNFESKMALCLHPAPEKPVPTLKTTNLWD